MSASGCQTGMPVLCCAHSRTPEHTTGTGFALGRATMRAEWRHSAWTAVSPAGRHRYQQGPSYSDPTWS